MNHTPNPTQHQRYRVQHYAKSSSSYSYFNLDKKMLPSPQP